jgi:hypothetical protein
MTADQYVKFEAQEQGEDILDWLRLIYEIKDYIEVD